MARQLIVGNQGRNHQVGAYQGSFRGRERIAYQDLPSPYELEQILEQLTANITLRTEDIPRRHPYSVLQPSVSVGNSHPANDLQATNHRTDKKIANIQNSAIQPHRYV